MPVFSVMITRRLEQTATIDVTAKDADAAQAKVEKRIDAQSWEKLTEDTEVAEDSDEITVEDVAEQ